MRRILVLLAAVALVTPAAAQSCSNLSFTGSVTSGSSFSIDLTGSLPDAFTILAIGRDAGTTTLFSGSNQIVIDLDFPFVPAPMGRTDANGDLTVGATVPTLPGGISIPMTTLMAQAVSVDISFMGGLSISSCTSNVISVTIGS